jgi:hypothetical protein
LVEAEEHNSSAATWAAFLVASALMLIIANLLLNYDSANQGGTPIDVIGAILPYALVVSLVAYYLMKSNIRAYRLSRSPLRGFRASFPRILKLIVFILGSVILLSTVILAVFQVLFNGYSPIGLTFEVPSTPNSGTLPFGNPAEAAKPLLDLWPYLIMLTVIVTTATLFSAIVLGKRHEEIHESTDQEDLEGPRSATSSLNTFVDDSDRAAILAYYAQGRDHMVSTGVPLTEATTPREFEKNVLDLKSAAGKDFTSLTRLFEEARFSVHDMGKPQKKKAKRHYERVRRTTSITGRR